MTTVTKAILKCIRDDGFTVATHNVRDGVYRVEATETDSAGERFVVKARTEDEAVFELGRAIA
jgi:hypothetical protein